MFFSKILPVMAALISGQLSLAFTEGFKHSNAASHSDPEPAPKGHFKDTPVQFRIASAAHPYFTTTTVSHIREAGL